MVRYYGYYSNVARGKRNMLEEDELIPSVPELAESLKERQNNWARLIQKTYEIAYSPTLKLEFYKQFNSKLFNSFFWAYFRSGELVNLLCTAGLLRGLKPKISS